MKKVEAIIHFDNLNTVNIALVNAGIGMNDNSEFSAFLV